MKTFFTGWKPVPPFFRSGSPGGTGILPAESFKPLLCCVLLGANLGCSPSPSHEQARSEKMPSQMTLLSADNFKDQLASSQEELIFINFWATWCDPCREEFPDVVRVQKEYRGKGVAFWAVSCDTEDDRHLTIPQFLANQKSELKHFWIKPSEPERIINAVSPDWSGALPATFIFRRSGEQIFEHTGEEMSHGELRAAVEQALKGER